MVAPAATNSESGKPDLMPAPGSIAISAPSALNFFIESGEAATRGSDGSISLATAIFMGPPAGAGHARERVGACLAKLDTGPGTACVQYFRPAPPGGGAGRKASGQENRHHGKDENDGGGAVFHQHDKALISLLMGQIIVAVSGRVGHFVMLCHRSLGSIFASILELPQSRCESNGDRPFVRQRQPAI